MKDWIESERLKGKTKCEIDLKLKKNKKSKQFTIWTNNYLAPRTKCQHAKTWIEIFEGQLSSFSKKIWVNTVKRKTRTMLGKRCLG